MPSGVFLGWLQSLPDAEPAIYGDPKAPVKENGGSARLRLRGRAAPLWVAEAPQCLFSMPFP